MATTVLGLKTFTASDPVDYNEINDNYNKIDTGVKTALQGRAAHNLLDNSNFSDLVAQAGLNGAHGSTAYIADRWIGNVDITPTAKTDGILLTTTNQYAFIQQRVKITQGKTYTLAISTTGGTTMQRITVFNTGLTEIFASVEGANGVITATFEAAYDDMAMLLYPGYVSGGGSAIFQWAALYEGAYTADTLPAYVPKGYAAELAACQQRFHVYATENARPSDALDCCPPMILAPGQTVITQGTMTVGGKTLYYNSTDL